MPSMDSLPPGMITVTFKSVFLPVVSFPSFQTDLNIFFYSSSYLIYRKMRSSSANVSFSTSQERARRRRNRNITLVLIGIIFLFLVCHIGEVAISIYELVGLLDEERKPFPKWANNIVIVNHLLIVINSSLNFVIYCKDVVFR